MLYIPEFYIPFVTLVIGDEAALVEYDKLYSNKNIWGMQIFGFFLLGVVIFVFYKYNVPLFSLYK